MNCLQSNWQKKLKQVVALLLGVKAILGAEGLHQPYLTFAWLLYYF